MRKSAPKFYENPDLNICQIFLAFGEVKSFTIKIQKMKIQQDNYSSRILFQ